MNTIKFLKIMVLNVALISSACIAASDSRNSFQNIHTVDELLALPTSKLCVDGGPSSDDIRLILLNGPLTLPMYQNEPAMARMTIEEQSISIKARIREECSVKPKTSSRKLTKEMLRNESETCTQGAPTKDEIKAYIKESNDPSIDIDIDKQLRAIPYEYRLIMEEGAKLKGFTLREVFIDDVTTKASQGWEKVCTSKSYLKNKSENLKIDRNKRKIPINSEEEFRIADKRLNDAWKGLPSDTRQALLPSQRKWIKQQATCKQDTKCLIDITNKRIIELEIESKDAKY